MLPDADSPMARPVAAWLVHLVSPAIRRVLIYGCVGVAASVFYSLAVIAFVHLLHPISPTVASIVAFGTTLPIAYFAHARISFSDRAYDTFQPLRFTLFTAASFVVSIGGMYWITEIAGRSYLLGIAWNWLIIPAMNFISYLLWVFRTARNNEGTG